MTTISREPKSNFVHPEEEVQSNCGDRLYRPRRAEKIRRTASESPRLQVGTSFADSAGTVDGACCESVLAEAAVAVIPVVVAAALVVDECANASRKTSRQSIRTGGNVCAGAPSPSVLPRIPPPDLRLTCTVWSLVRDADAEAEVPFRAVGESDASPKISSKRRVVPSVARGNLDAAPAPAATDDRAALPTRATEPALSAAVTASETSSSPATREGSQRACRTGCGRGRVFGLRAGEVTGADGSNT